MLRGQDVLDIIAEVEERAGADLNAQLTLLTNAICMVALRSGLPRKALMAGLEQSYKNTKRHTVPVTK